MLLCYVWMITYLPMSTFLPLKKGQLKAAVVKVIWSILTVLQKQIKYRFKKNNWKKVIHLSPDTGVTLCHLVTLSTLNIRLCIRPRPGVQHAWWYHQGPGLHGGPWEWRIHLDQCRGRRLQHLHNRLSERAGPSRPEWTHRYVSNSSSPAIVRETEETLGFWNQFADKDLSFSYLKIST